MVSKIFTEIDRLTVLRFYNDGRDAFTHRIISNIIIEREFTDEL